MRKMWTLVGLLVVSMFTVGIWAAAQAPRPPQSGPAGEPPTVISGNDLGFRMEHRRGNTAVGRFVVRINGQWLDVEESVVAKRLTAR